MRGIQCNRGQVTACPRFIPAHAGNTVCLILWFTNNAVHPRACGEYLWQCTAKLTANGSSPRMRGILKPLLHQYLFQRFIPAHAGNTTTHRRKILFQPVHPRACGEYSVLPIHGITLAGSSPRMRGIRELSSVAMHSKTVHPRACGEYTPRS